MPATCCLVGKQERQGAFEFHQIKPRSPEMLYREVTSNRTFSIRNLALAVVASVGAARRRRTELDLLAMSPHLKRDLGLLDSDLGGLMD
jgi:hypothetical protein